VAAKIVEWGEILKGLEKKGMKRQRGKRQQVNK